MKFRRSQFVLALAAGLCFSAGAFARDTAGSGPAKVGPAPSAPASKYKLSAAQLAEAQARVQLANAIAQNVAADARAKGLADDWRINLLSGLYNTPSQALRNIGASASTLEEVYAQNTAAQEQAVAAKTATSAAAAGHSSGAEDTADDLGSNTDSLVFTPKTPCRFIDTRVTGGAVGTTARVFDTFNYGNTYGGSSSCTLPGNGEPAIAANATVVGPSTSAGYLVVRPYGSSNITSWINWYQTGTVLANAGIISTAVNSSTSHYDFEMVTGGGTTQVVLDYFGYFSAAPITALNCSTTAANTASIAANSDGAVTAPSCPSGTAAVSINCMNTYGTSIVTSRAEIQYCSAHNYSGSGTTLSASMNCCSIP